MNCTLQMGEFMVCTFISIKPLNNQMSNNNLTLVGYVPEGQKLL